MDEAKTWVAVFAGAGLVALLLTNDLCQGCTNNNLNSRVAGVETKVHDLSVFLSADTKTENVVGGEAPETFYTIGGVNAYTHVEGQQIEALYPPTAPEVQK